MGKISVMTCEVDGICVTVLKLISACKLRRENLKVLSLFCPNEDQCKPCKQKVKHSDRPQQYTIPATDPTCSKQCCARYCLMNEPDFLEQREWIREVIENRVHYIIYYPKYHCELNFIERIWGYMKARIRKECDYIFAGLKARIPLVITSLKISFIRKVVRSYFRFMKCCENDLEGGLLEYVSKQYRSHRRIPDEVFQNAALMTQYRNDYEEKVQIKMEMKVKLNSTRA